MLYEMVYIVFNDAYRCRFHIRQYLECNMRFIAWVQYMKYNMLSLTIAFSPKNVVHFFHQIYMFYRKHACGYAMFCHDKQRNTIA